MDSPGEVQAAGAPRQRAVNAATNADAPHVISDSGSSSTEVDDDDDEEGGRTPARAPPRLPATWAFSQRAVSSSAAAPSAAQRIRRRLRYPENHLLSLCHLAIFVTCSCQCGTAVHEPVCAAAGRASGCTTPARPRRPPGASRTSCCGCRLQVGQSRSPAAPPRSASPKRRVGLLRKAHPLLREPSIRRLPPVLPSAPLSNQRSHRRSPRLVSLTGVHVVLSAESLCCLLRVRLPVCRLQVSCRWRRDRSSKPERPGDDCTSQHTSLHKQF